MPTWWSRTKGTHGRFSGILGFGSHLWLWAITVEGTAALPPGAGTLVAADWDLEGTGHWLFADSALDGTATPVTTRTTHAYDRPGTYFAGYHAFSHRDGKQGSGRPVRNIARVRLVVR